MQVKRIEHKFMLNSCMSLIAKKNLDAIMKKDKNCVRNEGYEVRSLYFDTLSDRAWVEKEEGLRVHEKIRIRVYGCDDKVIKLESKRKNGEYQIKDSLLIDRDTLENLCAGNYKVLLQYDAPIAMYFYTKLSSGMMPKVIIQYKRFSYYADGNNTRVTFDSDIRATESCFDLLKEDLLTTPICPADCVIMEVKYNHFLFGYIKRALKCVSKSVTSYSKYYSGRMFHKYLI